MERGGVEYGGWRAALALSACHAGVGAGPPPPTADDFTIAERAETGPVTALAARAPYLWAAGASGLRRWDVTTGDYDVVGDGDTKGTHALTAVAVDDEGSAWVASAEETGRWVVGKGAGQEGGRDGELAYQTAGSPGDVVALAPRRPVKTKGVWAGGPGGLFRYDGHRWSVVDGLRGAAVSWVALDADGVTAWVGTRDKGLFKADDRGAKPAPGGAAVGCAELLGMATTAAGTRVVVGNVNGDAWLYALTLAGTVELHAPVGTHAVALVQRGSEALLVAGPVGHERAFTLRALDPGEPVPSGGLRFTEVGTEIAHWAGAPVDVVLPAAVTAATAIGADLYVGSIALGVARAEASSPHFLGGSELVGDADRFTVACRAHDHCLIVTDGPQAWQTDGDKYRKTSVGEAADATVLAVAADREGNTFAVSAGPSGKGLVVTRRAAGQNDWTPVARAALELPPKTTPKASFAGDLAGGRAVGRYARLGRRRRRRRLRRRGDRSADGGSASSTGRAGAGEIGACRGAAAAGRSQRRSVRRRRDLVRVAVRAWRAFSRGSSQPGARPRGSPSELCWGVGGAATARSGRRPRRGWRASTARAGTRAAGGKRRCTASPPTTRGGCGRRPPRDCGSPDAAARSIAGSLVIAGGHARFDPRWVRADLGAVGVVDRARRAGAEGRGAVRARQALARSLPGETHTAAEVHDIVVACRRMREVARRSR